MRSVLQSIAESSMFNCSTFSGPPPVSQEQFAAAIHSPRSFLEVQDEALFRSKTARCSEKLYHEHSESFLGLYCTSSYEGERELQKALLRLYDPANPNAGLLVGLWRGHEQAANGITSRLSSAMGVNDRP